AWDGWIFRLDGNPLGLGAHHGRLDSHPVGLEVPLVRGAVMGRSILDREAVHVVDLQAETEEFPEGSAIARRLGFHTLLSVPLLREGVAIGAIGLRRIDFSPFTDKQIALAKTFADQAVIAIQNVRFFTDLQEKNRALPQAQGRSPRRWSSRPRRARSSERSRTRRPTWSRCSRSSCGMPPSCAKRRRALSGYWRVIGFGWWRPTMFCPTLPRSLASRMLPI